MGFDRGGDGSRNQENGASDGARTLDLRRDRPALYLARRIQAFSVGTQISHCSEHVLAACRHTALHVSANVIFP